MSLNNIISHVRFRGHIKFEKEGFSQVDSLILSQLSYLQFDHFLDMKKEEDKELRIVDIYKTKNYDAIFENVRDKRSNIQLFNAMAKSRRYKNTIIKYFVNDIDIDSEKQFCAVTFSQENIFTYIAFRGTDTTFVGWKEDFNMGFMDALPSQISGLNYLNYVSEKLEGDFMLGGHSKGGNIAVYAGISAQKSIQDRIIGIFNHDGPGFRDNIFKLPSYGDIKDKIHKTVPKASLVGMLLRQHEEYRVVKSHRMGILQHDPFSWVVKKGEFEELESLSESSVLMNETVAEWLDSLDDNTRQIFVDTLYSIINSTGAVYAEDLKDNWHEAAKSSMETLNNLDPEMKKILDKTLELFFKIAGENLRTKLQEDINSFKNNVFNRENNEIKN